MVAMTIQSKEKFMDALWDWGILKGCFGSTKIEPSDVDGLVERNGHFLILEAKNPGVKIKQGQWWTLNALRNTGFFTAIIVWGKANQPEMMQILYPKPYEIKQPQAADINVFRRVVAGWFKYADSKGGKQ